ncbi:MAG: enamine deaminase RidA (YjgF/YER057c/UK114 family) [Planctomycetota bacterium]|jgi:enamine deaminase RidA (YjgF/YER057c/UK114 family)
MQILQPKSWPKPKGYSNGILAKGELIFVGGQIGWDENETFPSADFAEQVRLALNNTLTILKEAGANAEHIVRMTWFITDKQEYLSSVKAVGQVYREVMGRHFPAMSMVQVLALIEDEAKVEIETTAVIPDK